MDQLNMTKHVYCMYSLFYSLFNLNKWKIKQFNNLIQYWHKEIIKKKRHCVQCATTYAGLFTEYVHKTILKCIRLKLDVQPKK